MLLMIIPGFLLSRNQDILLTKRSANLKNIVVADKVTEKETWDSIPPRAVALQDIELYEDEQLTKSVGKLSAKTQLDISEIAGKAFKLKDGKYILADKKNIISDVTISQEIQIELSILIKVSTYFTIQ